MLRRTKNSDNFTRKHLSTDPPCWSTTDPPFPVPQAHTQRPFYRRPEHSLEMGTAQTLRCGQAGI
ncbi:hypothetical protein BDM02DRAFT_3112662 [Thelephora ganbajun]|uniref:Uncharacterized protein n=1 Tax=Thelephora ganbajun TaxID=370292 RepID=A0ACB6ZKZ7_THEGA|nr:hypothetical protein BDM02DRAFT_3112662 [Thelephora ganbajun]